MSHQQAADPEECLCGVAQTCAGIGQAVMHVHFIALREHTEINADVWREYLIDVLYTSSI